MTAPKSQNDPEAWAWTALFAQASQELEVVRTAAGVVLVAPQIDSLLFNRALVDDPGEVAAVAQIYEARGVHRYMITLPPGVSAEADASHNLVPFHRPWIRLACRPQPQRIESSGFGIRPARSDDARVVGELYCRGFDVPERAAALIGGLIGRPHWHVYVAELDDAAENEGGAIVGIGISYLDRGQAYLFGGVTAPKHRCRGVQRALIAARVNHAHRCGATLVSTETGVAIANQPNHSQNNLERAGLKIHHCREHLVRAGTTGGGGR